MKGLLVPIQVMSIILVEVISWYLPQGCVLLIQVLLNALST